MSQTIKYCIMAHENHANRVVVLIDMDCFYCQVEEKLDPKLEGKPIAVVQYNAWRGGGIIAVNYPARDKGVTRHMRGDDAKKMCPEIVLCRVPQIREKADLTKYREAGKRVADVLQTFTALLERASVDEAYLDITDAVNKKIGENCILDPANMRNTHVVGCDNIGEFIHSIDQNRDCNESNYKLAVGGFIVEEIRTEVVKRTGYKCSAGIAHNKILAKLACGLHKPNQQTILPHNAVPLLYENLPIRKIRSLGGKFGEELGEHLGISTMGELSKFTEKELLKRFDEKTANWLHNIARGLDLEPVTTKLISKSIGCCKKFPGKAALKTQDDIDHWLSELALEIAERLQQDLEENNRKAKQMVISFGQEINGKNVSGSRTQHLNSYEQVKIMQIAVDVIRKNCARPDGNYFVKFLGISVGNFEDLKNVREITSFFKNMGRKSQNMSQNHFSTSENDSSCAKEESIAKIDEHDFDNSISCSIYSKTTEEDESDYQNLVYYDDILENSEGCLNISKKSNNSVDAISQELAEDNSKESIILESKIPDSFFAKYFDGNSVESSNIRDFNTSKVFNEDSHEDLSEDTSAEENTSRSIKNSSEHNIPSVIQNVDYFKQTCTECNKQFDIAEFQCHMDYHYAIKLVKNEAHLYKDKDKNDNREHNQKKSQNSPKNCSNKRKCSDSPGILTYLNKKEGHTENKTETCEECGRRLSIDDMPSHVDFHYAKKLHLEINSNSAPSSRKQGNIQQSSNSKHPKKNAGASSKVRGINSFFKTL